MFDILAIQDVLAAITPTNVMLAGFTVASMVVAAPRPMGWRRSNVLELEAQTIGAATSLPPAPPPRQIAPDLPPQTADDFKPKKLLRIDAPPLSADEQGPILDMLRLEKELRRDRLGEIATLVRALTYGEMMELAAAMWKAKRDGDEVTDMTLPTMLHRWSTPAA